MHCPECDCAVETDPQWYDSPREELDVERLVYWHGDSDVRGDYEVSDVGDVFHHGEKRVRVCLRVDSCMNCGKVLARRTYTKFV